MKITKSTLFNTITATINNLDTHTISEERKAVLQPLIDFIQERIDTNQTISINFICTHNSRRSHLMQIWAQTLAHHFNIKNFFSYSAGTESTALFPMIIETIQKIGFEVEKIAAGDNPIYSIKYADNEHPIIGFSKTLDNNFNPKSAFAAVLTCDSANEACPFVAGAEKRIPITFEDPKVFDNTPQQAAKYMERSLQIATELFYIFDQIKK